MKPITERVEELLDRSNCPGGCDGYGTYPEWGADGDPEPAQCQWCYEVVMPMREKLTLALTETDQQAREEERARIAMLTSGLTFTQMIDSISSKTHVDGVELHRVIKSSIETALEITDPSLSNPPSQV